MDVSELVELECKNDSFDLTNIDMMDITFGEDQIDLDTKFSEYTPKHILIKDVEFAHQKHIDSGIYGVVHLYQNEDGEKIVLKLGKIMEDIEAYNLLVYNECQCDDLMVKVVECNKETLPEVYHHNNDEFGYIIMNYFDGDLYHFVADYVGLEKYYNNITYSIILHIAKKVTEACICLKKCDMYYVDIKFDNIFFKCIDTNTIDVVLGDLGSASYETVEYKYAFKTYMPINRVTDVKGIDSPVDESDVVWNIGFLILTLMVHYENDVKDYKNAIDRMHRIDTKGVIDYTEMLYKATKDNPLIADILYNTLHSNMYEEYTLEQLSNDIDNRLKYLEHTDKTVRQHILESKEVVIDIHGGGDKKKKCNVM